MTQRRGNGLLADAYVPLILLAPSHADLMLEALRRSGIAAYAVPLAGDVLEPAGGEADTPPTDHLYVDADERPAAEQVLGTELPEIGLQGTEGTEDGEGGADPNDSTENPSRGDLLDGPPDSVDPGGESGSADDEVWKDLVARFYDEREDPADQRRAWPGRTRKISAPRRTRGRFASSRIGDLLAGVPQREGRHRRRRRR